AIGRSTGVSFVRGAPPVTTPITAATCASAIGIERSRGHRVGGTEMAFIETIPVEHAADDVKAMYERQFLHYGDVPNYALVFCHRPEIMRLWAQLLSGIKRHMDKRRFELVTFAAAHALRSTLCSLAHGKTLTEFLSAAEVIAIARGDAPESLTDAEAAMLEFVRKVARDASSVTSCDVERLKHM